MLESFAFANLQPFNRAPNQVQGSTERAESQLELQQRGSDQSGDALGPAVILPEAVRPAQEVTDATAFERRPAADREAVSVSVRAESPSVAERPSATEPGSAPAAGSNDKASDPAAPADEQGTKPGELTKEQEAQVAELQKRDREVRAHENAHAAVGGAYAGSPTYVFTTGPDGKQYATGGSVSIDTSPIPNDPAATVQKMATVIRAALAPAEPSAQDRNVAQAAQAKMAIAQAQAQEQRFDTATVAAGGLPSDNDPSLDPSRNDPTNPDNQAKQAASLFLAATAAYQGTGGALF